MIRPYKNILLAVLIIALLFLSVGSLSLGAVSIEFAKAIAIIMEPIWGALDENITPQETYVIWQLRAPRAVMAILIGAALACSGAALQGLFRNPLADPGLIGVSSGAALGAVSVIVLGASYFSGWSEVAGQWALPAAAFVGGLLVTIITYQVATCSGQTNVATLLLAGIAINAICGAGTGLLTYIADDNQLRSLTFWSMGSLAQAKWSDLSIVAPLLLGSTLLLLGFSRVLNSFLLGESVASHLGFSVSWSKRCIVMLSALAVGCAVAVSGIIGFVGLVVPHIIRMLIGPDHRYLLPTAIIGGAVLMLLADLLARSSVAPAELPIGLIMSLIGGPFFMFLLLSKTPGRSS